MKNFIEKNRKHLLCFSIASVFLVTFILTLDDYGISWDSGIGELFLGDKNLYYYLTFDEGHLDLDRNDIPEYQMEGHPDLFRTGEYVREKPFTAWPLGNTLSSLTKHLLFTRFSLMDPFEAHHLANGILIFAFLFLFYHFLRREFGDWASIIATAALLLTPRFIAHAHINVKDVPSTIFLSTAVILFYQGFAAGRTHRIIMSALAWGAALATKGNALFVPLILFPFFSYLLFERRSSGEALLSRREILCLSLYPFLGVAIFLLSWPSLVVDFPNHLMDHVNFLRDRGLGGPPEWQIEPLASVFFTTPLSILFLSLIGLAALVTDAIRDRRRGEILCLLLAWLLLPIFRHTLPSVFNHDVIRRFQEFLPALAAIAGVGGWKTIAWAASIGVDTQTPGRGSRMRRKRVAAAALVLALFLPLTLWNVANHPFQLAYYNSLVGGLAGAQARNFSDATDYWGSSYRNGMEWLNDNVEEDSILVVGVGEHIVDSSREIWLRSDIEFLTWEEFSEARSDAHSGSPIYFMYITRPYFYTSFIRDLETYSEPVFVLEVDGASILKIHEISTIITRSSDTP